VRQNTQNGTYITIRILNPTKIDDKKLKINKNRAAETVVLIKTLFGVIGNGMHYLSF
jgi:hypothetical protein